VTILNTNVRNYNVSQSIDAFPPRLRRRKRIITNGILYWICSGDIMRRTCTLSIMFRR